MVIPSISHPESRLQEHSLFTLKDHLVNLGLNALRDGDWRRVELITLLIREGGLTHE